MTALAPAGVDPAHVLPQEFSEAADLLRPVLEAGGEPQAAIILIDIEAQGVGG